jgi:hypothetical protein
MKILRILVLLALATCAVLPPSEPVRDEAMRAGRTAASLPAADEDYFHGMDGGVALSAAEVRGRDAWLVWTGGDDRLWDLLTDYTFGAFDLLKIVSSYPGAAYSRDNRFAYFGLVNEPCFDRPSGPDPQRHGLWLDRRQADCPPDPFENAQKYRGVAFGARGAVQPAGSYYGMATGIMGLRLFPNPAFDAAAAAAWDPVRYYTDPGYYNRRDLVRPYRVGVACGFCHVGPNPLHPPADPEHPAWSDLSSLVGAQYFWVDRIFSWSADPANFIFQILHTARPGSLDTSLVSSDNINNPRTMNAIYGLGDRLAAAQRWGQETLAGGELDNKQFNDFVSSGPLTQFFTPPDTVHTTHVLKDGSDSVGPLGALNRVYLNIGLFSEEWLRHFRPIIGDAPVSPIAIRTARANSAYWDATEQQTPDMARFLLAASAPHHLRDAPGGAAYLTADAAQLGRGKVVFAENCARCHSSKAPVAPADADVEGCAGPDYMACFGRYWAWTQTDGFKREMTRIVQADDFLAGNYLSNDMRIPVTLLGTNACSPAATNALRGNIWDNFSSESYKTLPSVGSITVYDPFTGAPRQWTVPGGGRGYTRVPSLISVWSTAPYLLNNSVGHFNPSPSVAARMQAFDDGISQMLWPERRDQDPVLGSRIPGVIDRTTATSYVSIPKGYLPDFLQRAAGLNAVLFPDLFDHEGGLRLGPIPAGTPVDLLANLDLLAEPDDPAPLQHDQRVLDLILALAGDLKRLPPDASDAQARQVFANLGERLYGLSKCPDYVVNRGHLFGTTLPDGDKRALIEFLKTF